MLLYLNSKRDALELYDGEPLALLHSVSLSTIEFNVLNLLYDNSSKSCSRQDLKKAGWPERVVGPNSLNVCIMHLRKKLKGIIEDSEIRVVPSHGYKLLLPTSIHLAGKDELPDIKRSASSKRLKVSDTDLFSAPSVDKRVKKKRIKPSVTAGSSDQHRFRWEDLILTVCIWTYTFTLYHSIYH
ncbi:DNA-binding winged helix-turn-helix (WHTH) protein [Vibrio crassostreae]|uniref:winged helix-turn-helix domain-containing protein n=1 Tax=Vibrio crassostreae TaxID=246167 RepID=UPI001B3100B8|nr:helix-turn-helix domain-containing protein [Vibrio crassostreae]CAK1711529.1 DNA-binding winged helix-turn-helix (WHTH) protein [Vibrio crassostreae]CAK2367439.1 DNA-binding winged helix-turn-helix (WHTH) protein [Vibrio crassostreae]CAK2551289.1 DNA-binding winged helix-turn-helix (WHTH) protein [Vibrio crassostreae]CAK3064698.1 DNA-binding winged helix-turn-helix (WHTH) protein [Vibrio crassostreae]CAK3112693.1 DNA-binding winged helix-turn-helix (WHTH) protein [Vibrio crassostreae]